MSRATAMKQLPIDVRFFVNLVWASDSWFDDGLECTPCLFFRTPKPRQNGYVQFWTGTRHQQAHIWLYERWVGPVPNQMTLDHMCHNVDAGCVGGPTCRHRSCVNPKHLVVAASRTNTLRGKGLSAVNAKATHCKHGHPFTERNTYVNPTTGKRVCKTCMARIKADKYWKERKVATVDGRRGFRRRSDQLDLNRFLPPTDQASIVPE